MYKYLGKEQEGQAAPHITGIPARDLTDEEAVEIEAAQGIKLETTGLYRKEASRGIRSEDA